MDKISGYILLFKKIQNHWLWTDKPFSKGQAWIDLLLMANYADGEILSKGIIVPIKRGQVFRTVKYLSERWGWSTKKTKLFLKTLENQKMALTEGLSNGTLITIEKYNDFQLEGLSKGTHEGPRRDHAGTTQGPQKNKEKERKINNKGNPTVWISEIVPAELQEVFIGWADMRDRIKKPIATRETVARAWAKVQKISRNPDTQKAVVEQSIDRCWVSFWELKDKPETKKYPEFEKVEEAPGVPMTAEQRKNQQKIIQELKKAF